ncbi:RagB/SusD family nutrient uptake outer membrane protein [Bacteroides sp. 51]|uniref:RagB/SusD family nutrient uptake outer membrane protein n=1 Tax=Bacteroides sp. 51 TaxID=2302938 RepID=UPI0013D6303A|nr:RagB/SusD family nutrient uptake outer membrane protein [Bacteroides sp. 51]NDV81029.1 RagB/SusD family nutrient uptake outer membrane protein [Bacteroides sp. 51]
MKKYIFILLSAVALVFTACEDILDRPQLNNPQDDNYWRNENDLRLYANGFYVNYFVGYNSSWGTAYAPLRGYMFSDDVAVAGKQTSFENSIPSTRGGTSETPEMLTQYSGPSWNFAWVRKSNIFLDRIENVAKPNITTAVYEHWTAAARFFRGFEYSRLVSVFGDVPYYDKVFDEKDEKEMFKTRTPRGEVMDKVYDDFEYVMTYLREDDGAQYLNRYIAAGFISRLMLFEGSWQLYHTGDKTRAEKYLKQAFKASEYIINSGKWAVSGDFRTLFGSQDLKGHKEVIMYRHYDAALSVTHHIASYSNGAESQPQGPNLALAKSFLCNDGKPYESSGVTGAKDLDLGTVLKTRDPRFEATFWHEPKVQSATLLYACKFIDRVGPTYWNSTMPSIYGSMTNTNDYPVLRYSEVLLNWIEIKQELAENFSGAAVTQKDIDISINAIRDRELDLPAVEKGVQKTKKMTLTDIDDAFAPDRDPDVSALLWEIRRERRMEFVFEHTRLLDIKRWKKLNYMSNAKVGNKLPDNMLGLWIDMQKEAPDLLKAGNDGKYTARQVMKEDGTIVTYDGSNATEMVGYYVPQKASARDSFTDRSYMSPVGRAQINQYAEKGVTLSQTTGWE